MITTTKKYHKTYALFNYLLKPTEFDIELNITTLSQKCTGKLKKKN